MRIIHLVDDTNPPVDYDAPITVVTALCGAQGMTFDDGAVLPLGFDYVIVPDFCGFTTCPACLATKPTTEAP